VSARISWLCRAGAHIPMYVPERGTYVCRRGCGTEWEKGKRK
jgi:hypothetical protein